MEKQSQMAGKSGVERLIAQRDQLISRWQKEQSAVDSITKSYEKLIKAEEGKGGGSKFGGFAEKAKEFFENPLQSIKGTATSVMEAMGPLWSGIAAGAAALGTLAAVGLKRRSHWRNTGFDQERRATDGTGFEGGWAVQLCGADGGAGCFDLRAHDARVGAGVGRSIEGRREGADYVARDGRGSSRPDGRDAADFADPTGNLGGAE